jgi:C1A family cysteine protease
MAFDGLKNYKSGIFSGDCSVALHHGVAIIGYGEENGVLYYLVKNSFGKDWGDHGYFKIIRTLGEGPGKCGIQISPTFA